MGFDLRTTIVKTITGDTTLQAIFGDRVMQYQQGLEVARPFIVYRMGLESEYPGWRNGPIERVCDLWVHDKPGDYQRIDDTIARVRLLYTSLASQDEFVEARFVSKGPELQDPEMGTILRVARFLWTTTK